MSITGSDKGRCEVIAYERDVGGMGAVGDVEGAARGGGVDEGRGLDAGKIDVGKIDGVLGDHAGDGAHKACGVVEL